MRSVRSQGLIPSEEHSPSRIPETFSGIFQGTITVTFLFCLKKIVFDRSILPQDHKSHDILLLCLDCHAECNAHENELRIQLAIQCDAPVGTERDVKVSNVKCAFDEILIVIILRFHTQMKLDRRLGEVQKAANALMSSRHLMPAERVAELEARVMAYYEVDTITPDILERAMKLEIRIPNADYVPHGLKVVRYFEERHRAGDGILKLERTWREHFLATMKPRFLPALWSVEHHRRPEQKWSGPTTIDVAVSSSNESYSTGNLL